MADIREGLQGINEPDRSIGFLLIEFYERMKALERDEHRGGKQATAIVMAINDVKTAAGKEIRQRFDKFRFDPSHHLGMGDIRLTVAQQDELASFGSSHGG